MFSCVYMQLYFKVENGVEISAEFQLGLRARRRYKRLLGDTAGSDQGGVLVLFSLRSIAWSHGATAVSWNAHVFFFRGAQADRTEYFQFLHW